MFLVFEKEVLSMDADEKELDLYFLEKHEERMNHELRNYKKKMNMSEKDGTYRVYTKLKTLYVYAKDELQARAYAVSLGYEPIKSEWVMGDELMRFNGQN